MREQTFTYNGATVTVRVPTIRDQLAIEVIMGDLPGDESRESRYARLEFARMVHLSTIVGDLGLPFPARDAGQAALAEGFTAWLASEDRDLLFRWREALKQAEKTPNEPALQPGQKKEPAPSEND